MTVDRVLDVYRVRYPDLADTASALVDMARNLPGSTRRARVERLVGLALLAFLERLNAAGAIDASILSNRVAEVIQAAYRGAPTNE